jgi:N-succinyldiaminopimelate aminotransferase
MDAADLAGQSVAGRSVFSVASELAARHGAINLAQGFPDDDPPQPLLDAAVSALLSGANQYTPSDGLPLLREAVARHTRLMHGVDYDADSEVTVTAGATEAISTAMRALLGPGEEVVVVSPFYELYMASAALTGATVRVVRTRFPDFRLDLDAVAAAFSPKTRLVVVNTPGNPSGQLLSRSEIAAIGELAEGADALILADETYAELILDGSRHVAVASDPRCRPRTITVSSASKTLSATGWRIGWALAAPALTSVVRGLHQHVTFAAATPLQHAVAAALEAPWLDAHLRAQRREYASRCDTLLHHLRDAGHETNTPRGGYFALAKVGCDDLAYCRELPASAGVAAIPGSALFAPGDGDQIVRFCFCKRPATLVEAGRRLTAHHSVGPTEPT